ncbi:MAG TPA: GvpL/GvpF family gas vesicle protein [Rhodothermales bacterium]
MKLRRNRRGDLQLDELADQLLEQNASVLDAARESLKKKLLEAAMKKALSDLGDPDAIAQKLLEQLGEDNEAVVNASEALKSRLLSDIAKRSMEPLSDPNTAAEAALRFIDLSDERIEEAGKAVRERLLERVVSGAIETMIDEEVSAAEQALEEETPEVDDHLEVEPAEPDLPPEFEPVVEESDHSDVISGIHTAYEADPTVLPDPDETLEEEFHIIRDPWNGDHEEHPNDEPRAPRWVNRISYEDDQVKQFRQTVTSREIPCFYTYGVVAANTPDHVLPPFGIEPDNPPYALPCGPVRAIVSQLTGSAFRRADRDERFEDPQLKRELKNAHVRVLEAIAASGHVIVPRPSGKFARSEDEIRRAVVTLSAAFDESLRKLAGRHEWSVQLFRRPGGSHEASLDDLRASLGDTELEVPRNGSAPQEPRGVIGLLRVSAFNGLKAVAEEAVLTDTEPTEDGGLMVMSAAFLVDEHREAAFRQALDNLRERYGTFGVTIDCRGPRMPLSFCQ